VIIWLNGPFGVGKTSAAHALVRRLPDGLLFDPEIVGSMLRQIVGGIDPVEDFQDLRTWRALVVDTARLLRATYRRVLVMPMTVWRQEYFDAVFAGLRCADADLRCFRLTASEEVLRARILRRPDADGPHEWCLAHLSSGLELMRDPRFGEEIPTDDRGPDETAEAILSALGKGWPVLPR
jgi:hypothetical protein